MIAAEEKAKVSPIGENLCGKQKTYELPAGFSVDPYLDRIPRPGYNCLDFTREVWKAMTGQDITAALTRLTGRFAERKATLSGFRAFKRLPGPQSPCLVVMQRLRFVPHLGIFLDGRILHMHTRGVEFQPLAVSSIYFQTLKYYR